MRCIAVLLAEHVGSGSGGDYRAIMSEVGAEQRTRVGGGGNWVDASARLVMMRCVLVVHAMNEVLEMVAMMMVMVMVIIHHDTPATNTRTHARERSRERANEPTNK